MAEGKQKEDIDKSKINELERKQEINFKADFGEKQQ